jgi:hypothetical protein
MNVINTITIHTFTKTIPPVKGRTLLLALGYNIGIAAVLGVLTGFGLPRVVPALRSIEWLSTIITTEVYLTFTGRETGRSCTIPVSYVEQGDVLLIPGGGDWKANLNCLFRPHSRNDSCWYHSLAA